MGKGQRGTWATVRNTVWDHVPPLPRPPSSGPGILQDSTQQLMDAQGAWAWVDGTSMGLDGPDEMHVARWSGA